MVFGAGFPPARGGSATYHQTKAACVSNFTIRTKVEKYDRNFSEKGMFVEQKKGDTRSTQGSALIN